MLLLQSWIPIKSVYFSYNAVSWCLSDQMFFYLMFPFLVVLMMNKSFKRILQLALPLIFTYILIMVFLPTKYVHPFFYINPLFRLIDFIVGIFLFVLYEAKIKKINLDSNISTIIEILSVAIIVFFVLLLKVYPSIVLYSIFYWIPLGLLILIFVYSEQILGGGILTKWLSNKVLLYFGSISFSFFIIHQLVIRTVSLLSNYYNIKINNIAGLFAVFILALLASIFCYHYIEKPISNKLNKKILV